ncbi:class I SAM-dependent methyltransferase [Defluviimonas sp. SAOS-178_SWC]|uniref:class I SAM-dependent methyltransferase n=1 Tax=Defluviimonas sp. SAOS-178_SWC TaxID=3121287 RepID=UPI003221B4A5
MFDSWAAGDNYETYMGRWSRQIAAEFLRWLAPAEGLDWLEIGCGSGALTSAILNSCAPASLLATDNSSDFVAHAKAHLSGTRAEFRVADAQALPLQDGTVDVVASALVLNFVPDKVAALVEMQRVLRSDGLLSLYVWDYPGGGIGFIDAFWKAAAQLDPAAAELDEGKRFPFCTAEGLAALCGEAGLKDVDVAAIEIMSEFPDFEAFWHPFTLGAGPAPGYCMNLDEDRRADLKSLLAEMVGQQGPVRLPARAWALRTRKAG